MTPVHSLIAKELRSFWISPIFYVIGMVFLFVSGFLSYLMVVNASQQAVRLLQLQNSYAQLNLNELVFRPYFYSFAIVLMFILPMLTMRVFAEERKLRTFELLFTSPIGINEIVSGKFMSVLILYVGLLGLTGLAPLLIATYCSFDWNPVLTGYLALMLQGGLFLAIGVLGSSLTDNQVVAAFISFGIILVIWLFGGLGALLGDTPMGNFLAYMSFTQHFDRLVRGLLDAKDIVYYVSSTVLLLFVTYRIIDAQRW